MPAPLCRTRRHRRRRCGAWTGRLMRPRRACRRRKTVSRSGRWRASPPRGSRCGHPATSSRRGRARERRWGASPAKGSGRGSLAMSSLRGSSAEGWQVGGRKWDKLAGLTLSVLEEGGAPPRNRVTRSQQRSHFASPAGLHGTLQGGEVLPKGHTLIAQGTLLLESRGPGRSADEPGQYGARPGSRTGLGRAKAVKSQQPRLSH